MINIVLKNMPTIDPLYMTLLVENILTGTAVISVRPK